MPKPNFPGPRTLRRLQNRAARQTPERGRGLGLRRRSSQPPGATWAVRASQGPPPPRPLTSERGQGHRLFRDPGGFPCVAECGDHGHRATLKRTGARQTCLQSSGGRAHPRPLRAWGLPGLAWEVLLQGGPTAEGAGPVGPVGSDLRELQTVGSQDGPHSSLATAPAAGAHL